MSNLRIVPINFVDQAVLSDSPAMVATLPVTNVQLTARDSPARSTSNANQIIQGHFNGDLRKADSFFMFRHNGQGGTLRLTLCSNPDFTGNVYDSGNVDIFTLIALGSYEWGSAPLGLASTDLLGAEAPYSLFFPTTTFASFILTLSACQSSYWEIGRLFLGKYLEAPYNPKDGMQFGWASNTDHQRSLGGSLRTRAGERWREFTANMIYATDLDRAAWRDVMAQIDADDFVISVFPGAGGRQERDYVANMKNVTHSPFAWTSLTFNETTLKFTEV